MLDSANIETAASKPNVPLPLEVQRQRAGQQRHDDGRGQQAARHAATDAAARQQARDAGVGAQRERAAGQQQEQESRCAPPCS